MTKKKSLSTLAFKNEGSSVEINIYGVVDGDEISAKLIKQTLDAATPETITLRINSVGGDVQEGVAIGNVIKSYGVPTTAYIDSMCASIATVIACSADKVVMAANATFMIHKPAVLPWDALTAADMRSTADALDVICESMKQTYLARKLTIDEKKLDDMMAAETWMTAQQALDYGFVDEVGQALKAVACATKDMLALYKHTPTDLAVIAEDDDDPQPPKEADKTLDELMQQLFDTVDQIKQQYKPGQNPPDPNQDDPEDPDTSSQAKLGNLFKAFLNPQTKEND